MGFTVCVHYLLTGDMAAAEHAGSWGVLTFRSLSEAVFRLTITLPLKHSLLIHFEWDRSQSLMGVSRRSALTSGKNKTKNKTKTLFGKKWSWLNFCCSVVSCQLESSYVWPIMFTSRTPRRRGKWLWRLARSVQSYSPTTCSHCVIMLDLKLDFLICISFFH